MEKQNFQDYNQMEKGDTTYFIYEDICFGDMFDSEKIEFTAEDVKSAIDLEAKPAFVAGIVECLCALGVDCSVCDIDLIMSEIKGRYRNRIGEACPKAIQNWLKGQKTSVSNRINNYNLCYALEMDLQETADFFMKHFFSIPFNYKDTTDAVFFYCLMRKRPYSIIKSMLETASTFQTTKECSEHTREIAKQICDINDDDSFMQYLSEHCYNSEQQYQRARAAIIRLINKHGGETTAELHEKVMGFNYQGKTLTGEKKNDFLPEEFTRSLPTDRTFLDILEGKKPETYETLRKALVILSFYDSYVDTRNLGEELTKKQVADRLYDFYEETDNRLLDCGLVPLYEKNLFDKVILFCANSKSPLDTFYGINDLRYTET